MAPRIRLQSFAPLPLFQVWFLIPENASDLLSLKLALCTQLSLLRDLDVSPVQLVLEMDGFELPEDSSIDLVREGDVLTLKHRDPIVSVRDTLKRKAKIVEKHDWVGKRIKVPTCKDPSSSSSSSSSDSPSSSSDSGTASSSSETSSDSSESETMSISKYCVPVLPNREAEPSNVLTTTPCELASRIETKHSFTQQLMVPPGFGKASTHSRNKRRKIKRKLAASQPSQLTGVSVQLVEDSDTQVSIHTRRIGISEPPTQPSEQSILPTVISSNLGNRNKKRGFKRAMEGAAPQRILFNSFEESAPCMPTYSPQTFIPPSERESLPHNVFVTSVDVEWRTGTRRAEWQDAREEPDEGAPDEVPTAETQNAKFSQSIDWDDIGTRWDKHRRLDASVTLSPGMVIAWKAFGLDPVSLTPQASMLHLGKVLSADQENVLVQLLTRLGAGHATFGRASVEEDQEPIEHISLPTKEVWSNDWKVISHQ